MESYELSESSGSNVNEEVEDSPISRGRDYLAALVCLRPFNTHTRI